MPRRKKDTVKLLDKPNHKLAKYDWQQARQYFVEGIVDDAGIQFYPTLKELAEKTGIPFAQINNRCSKERWQDARKTEMNRVQIERQKLIAKTMAKKQVKFNERAADDAMQSQIALGKRIKQMAELIELDTARVGAMMDRIEAGEQIDGKFRAELKGLVSSSEWESLWKAYALANEVGRKALGIRDEEVPNTTYEITQINHINPTQTLKELDRTDQLRAALMNSNMVIPGLTTGPEDDEDQEAIEAEIVDDGPSA